MPFDLHRRLSYARLCLLITFIAVGLRVAYVLTFPTDVVRIEVDAIEYDVLAQNLVAGHGFACHPGHPTCYRPPLWPVVLAGVYSVFGRSHLMARLVLALIGSTAPLLLMLATRRILSRGQNLALGVILACYPPLIVATGQLMTETVFTVLLAGVMLLAAEWAARPSWDLAVALGIVLGLAALARGNALLFAPLLAFWMATPLRAKAVRDVALTAAATALVLMPWVARNAKVHHALVPVSCNSGYTFSLSFFPDSRALYHGERAQAYVREAGRNVSSETVFDIVAEDNELTPDFVRSKIARDLPGTPIPTTEPAMDGVLMHAALE